MNKNNRFNKSSYIIEDNTFMILNKKIHKSIFCMNYTYLPHPIRSQFLFEYATSTPNPISHPHFCL